MSGLLAGKVWQSNLDGTLKPLAACLADIANDDGSRIYPSVGYICWLMGKSPRAIQYQLRKLEEQGILEVVSEPTGRTGEFKEFQMNESMLPRRKRWQLGAKIAPGKLGAKKGEPGAISAEPGAILDIPPYRDPSYDPSIPVKGRKQSKPIRAERFMLPPDSMLELTDNDLVWLKANAPCVGNVEQRIAGWYDKHASNQGKSRTIEEWKATWRSYMRNCSISQEAKQSHNGNGHRPSRVDISLAATRELLAEAEAERNAR